MRGDEIKLQEAERLQSAILGLGTLDSPETEVLHQVTRSLGLDTSNLTGDQIRALFPNLKPVFDAAIQREKQKANVQMFTPYQKYTIGRDETNRFEKQTKDAREAINNYKRMEAIVKQGKPFDRYGMVYMFNKMLDPGSVVRESEFANTQMGMGYMGKAQSYVEKLKGDGVITQEMAREMLATAKILADVAERELEIKTMRARERANQLGIDPDLVAPVQKKQQQKSFQTPVEPVEIIDSEDQL